MYHLFFKPLFLVFLLFSVSMAEINETRESSYIDKVHKKLSNKVIEWSEILDNDLSTWLGNDDINASCKSDYSISKHDSIDAFFQNDRYLNETKDVYVRLRLRNDFYSRESNRMNVRVNAQLPFDKCKKQWNIFLQDVNSNTSEVKTTDTSSGGIGVRYSNKGKFGIDASYSLGLQGGSPYIRARYRLPIKYNTWLIEPVQSFKYSTKYYFEEETNIYFDKYLDNDNLFRVQLYRETGSTLKGTDYGLTLQYFLNLNEDVKIELTQSFFGNTYYNDYYKFDENYNGINNYVTSVSWRSNIWRDWFYYEIKPTINFHKDYDYTPSYHIRFNFDFYLGIFNK